MTAPPADDVRDRRFVVPAPVSGRIGSAAGYAGAIGDALTAGIRLAETERAGESATVQRAVASMVERLRAELDDLALDTAGAAVLDDRAAEALIERVRAIKGRRTDDHR